MLFTTSVLYSFELVVITFIPSQLELLHLHLIESIFNLHVVGTFKNPTDKYFSATSCIK